MMLQEQNYEKGFNLMNAFKCETVNRNPTDMLWHHNVHFNEQANIF